MNVLQKRPILAGLFCLLAAYLTLFHELGTLPFFGSDEPRYAQIAKEMYQSGDLVTPTLEGRPWLEKPPLLFWTVATSFASLGASEWSARLPNAILSLLVVAGVGVFAGTFRGARCGLFAFMILITSLLYVGYARAATTDLPLTAAYTLAMVSGFLAVNRTSFLWALVCGLALGITVLAKGLVAIPLVILCLILYTIATQRRIPFGPALLAAASMVGITVPWLWSVWSANGENFVITFLVNQHIARIATDLHHHSQPFWYYLPVLLGGFFPWVLFLPASARSLWVKTKEPPSDERDLEILLWLWAALPFLFFSVSTGKLAGYILPIFPALSILIAIQWDQSIKNNHLPRWMLRGLHTFPFLAVVLVLGAIIGFARVFREPFVGIQLATVPLAASLVVGWALKQRNLAAIVVALVGFNTLGLALIHTQGAPIVGRFQSTRELCLEALPCISAERPLVFYAFHHFTTYYYAHGKVKPSPLHDPGALLAYMADKSQDSYIILTADHGWSELNQLDGTKLLRQLGNFYLVELVPTPDFEEKLQNLHRKHLERLRLSR